MRRKSKWRRLRGPLHPIHGRIAALRVAKGLSQKDLAVRLGVDKTAVSHWETGVAMPDISRLPALAEHLETSVDELLKEAA